MTLSAAVAAVLTGVVFVAAKPKSIAPSAPTAATPASLSTAATLGGIRETPNHTMHRTVVADAEKSGLEPQQQLAHQPQQTAIPGLPPEPQPGILYPALCPCCTPHENYRRRAEA